jgi:hypothetical protein
MTRHLGAAAVALLAVLALVAVLLGALSLTRGASQTEAELCRVVQTNRDVMHDLTESMIRRVQQVQNTGFEEYAVELRAIANRVEVPTRCG